MYIPSSFSEKNPDMLTDFIRRYPLGLLTTVKDEEIEVSPLPFICRQENQPLTLVAHFARANPHWKSLLASERCIVTFQGPDAYVSPDWYPSKQETHKAVPTWNYQFVKVVGEVSIIEDTDWIRAQIEELTDIMEQDRSCPWRLSDAPEDFTTALLKAVVGVEIKVLDIQAKFKLSQNRSEADQRGVVTGLCDTQEPRHNPELAAVMRKKLEADQA